LKSGHFCFFQTLQRPSLPGVFVLRCPKMTTPFPPLPFFCFEALPPPPSPPLPLMAATSLSPPFLCDMAFVPFKPPLSYLSRKKPRCCSVQFGPRFPQNLLLFMGGFHPQLPGPSDFAHELLMDLAPTLFTEAEALVFPPRVPLQSRSRRSFLILLSVVLVDLTVSLTVFLVLGFALDCHFLSFATFLVRALLFRTPVVWPKLQWVHGVPSKRTLITK